ncbi:MAG: hypothetical protein ACI4U2_07165 [Christensenellaceae bacterium]
MFRQRNRNNQIRKRGVSLVECCVAMLVISIVTISALSVMSSSASAAYDSYKRYELRARAATALDCFRYASTQDEFDDMLEKVFTYGEEAKRFTSGVHVEHSSAVFIYSYEEEGYHVYLAVDYEATETEISQGSNVCTFYSAIVRGEEWGKAIVISYQKTLPVSSLAEEASEEVQP